MTPAEDTTKTSPPPQDMKICKLRSKTYFQECCIDGVAIMKIECISLGVLCALEDSDQPGSLPELLELQPTFIPTIPTPPEVPKIKRRFPSLASLKRHNKTRSAARQSKPAQHESSNDKDTDPGHGKFILERPWQEPGRCLMTETGSCSACLGSVRIRNIAEPKQFLAGAASLGLRQRFNRTASEPPVQQAALTSKKTSPAKKTLKDGVHIDDGITAARSEPKTKKTRKVPCPPPAPRPAGRGRRPQVHGAPIFVISRANADGDSFSWDDPFCGTVDMSRTLTA